MYALESGLCCGEPGEDRNSRCTRRAVRRSYEEVRRFGQRGGQDGAQDGQQRQDSNDQRESNGTSQAVCQHSPAALPIPAR